MLAKAEVEASSILARDSSHSPSQPVRSRLVSRVQEDMRRVQTGCGM